MHPRISTRVKSCRPLRFATIISLSAAIVATASVAFAQQAGGSGSGASSTSSASGATGNAAPTTQSILDETLAKRKDLAAQISALGKADPKATSGTDALDVSTSEDELEFLEALDGVYGEQQARLEQRQELEAEKQRAEADLESLRKYGPTEAKPYSFLVLEDLRDELAAEQDHDHVNHADLKPAAQMLETARAHFDQAERDRRRVQEAVTENKHKERQAALENELNLAQRESQIAKELIVVRQLEVDVRHATPRHLHRAKDIIDREDRLDRARRALH